MFSGDLLFAGSIGRTDLPGGDHPTMLRSLRDKVLHAARRRRGAARPRRADQHRPRARHQPVPARPASTTTRRRPGHPRTLTMSQSHPAQRLPRAAARRSASSSSRCSTRLRAHLRAARLRQHRDPRGRAARPAAAQGRDRQGGLRPAPAAGRATTPATPASGCTST